LATPQQLRSLLIVTFVEGVQCDAPSWTPPREGLIFPGVAKG